MSELHMKLTIITISYNNREGLIKTVSSVKSQMFRDSFEYVVVDGGSSDGSGRFLEQNNELIDKWVSEPDKGIYNAMNKGVAMASGDYCLFLNSGDVLHDSDVISRALDNLDGTDLVIGKMIFLNDMSTSVVNEPLTMRRLYVGSLPHPATFIKTELLRENPYDETLRIVSDWKFFLQVAILENCSYKLIDDLISDFDCEGISSMNRDLCEQERSKVLEELFPSRVMLDYLRFEKGEGYSKTPYDKFYIKMRDYSYGRWLYTLNVMIMKMVAIFRKGARFARQYPTRLS